MTIATAPIESRKPRRAVEDRVLDLEELGVEDKGPVVTVSGIIARTGVIYRLAGEGAEERRERFGHSAFARLNMENTRLSLFAAPKRVDYMPSVIASTRAGTLRIFHDGDGLGVEFDIEADRHPGSVVAGAFRTGNLRELGISFVALRERTGPLAIVRTITEAKVMSLFIPFEGATVTPV